LSLALEPVVDQSVLLKFVEQVLLLEIGVYLDLQIQKLLGLVVLDLGCKA
jgi:hypothetical protein